MTKKTNLNKLSTDNYYKLICLDASDKKNCRLVFDYQKMWDDDCKIFWLLSERALRGKTYGFKEFSQKHFLKTGKPSIYYKNLEVQLMKERKNYLGYLGNSPDFDNFIIDKNGLFYTEDGVKKYSTLFRSVNGAYKDKGSRIPVDLMGFDEIMDGVEDLRTDQVNLINTAIATYNDPLASPDTRVKKIFFMSNFRTINSDILLSLGVYKIEDEITRIYDDKGNNVITILTPLYDEKEAEMIENELTKDPITNFIKITGGFDENYLNKNTTDILNNVIEKDISELIENKTYYRVLKGTKKYNHIIGYIENNVNKYHIVSTDYLQGFLHQNILKLNEKDFSKNHMPIDTNIRKNYLNLLNKGVITFQDLNTRVNFIQDLIKNH